MGGEEAQWGNQGANQEGSVSGKPEKRTFQEKRGLRKAVAKPRQQWQRKSLKRTPVPLKEFWWKEVENRL